MPLLISSITPTTGDEGASTGFSVTVAGGTPPYTYAWDMDGGATPNTPTTAAPTVTLSTPGTYHPSVVVTDSLSATGTTGSTLVVDPITPVITAIAPEGTAGLPLGEATFTVETTGTPTDWDWDFGIGALPATSTDESPAVTLQNPGTYHAGVTVTNSEGSDDSPITYVVGIPTMPEWVVTRLGYAAEKPMATAMCDDRLAILYTGAGLRLARALVENPESPADWQMTTVDPGNCRVMGAHSVAVCGDKLCIAYMKDPLTNDNTLGFARATTTDPTGPDDWVRYQLVESAHLSTDTNVVALYAQVDGIAVGWRGADFDRPLPHIGWTDSATTSTSSTDWDFHTLPMPATGGATGISELALIDDQLYALFQIAFSNEVFGHFLTRTTTFPPTDETDWMDPVLVGGNNTNAAATLGTLNGNLAFVIQNSGGLANIAYILLADGPTLEIDTTWSAIVDLPKPAGTYDVQDSFVTAAGRAAFPYVDIETRQIGLIRQVRVDPTESPVNVPWEYAPLRPTALYGLMAHLSLLADGTMAFSFVEKDTGNLCVAVAQGPY